jgi:hypothetical protein
MSFTALIHAARRGDRFDNFVSTDRFFEDAANGTLPNYSFIEPNLLHGHNDMHPSYNALFPGLSYAGHRPPGPRDPAPGTGSGDPLGLDSRQPGGPGQPTVTRLGRDPTATPEEVSRLLETAYEADPDFAVLLWLAATTGARRGELCALRWGSVDLEAAELLILRNLFQAAGRLVEKDTKTRRLALSEDSVALLEEHRRRCVERAAACGARLSDDAYVFSFDPAGRQPMHPDSVTHRFSRLARRLGLRTRLHDLRHYAATQLIAGGVDLRTVSGRIGHAGGGATTLRVYPISWRRRTDRRLRFSRGRSGAPAATALGARYGVTAGLPIAAV